jgi:peptidylprolyl isomerase
MLVLAMRKLLLAALLIATPALAAPKEPGDIVAAAPKSDWQALDPANTLYMDLPGGRVVIALAPAFAPKTVANIQHLAHTHYFDSHASILRSQDNYVVQWSRDPEPPTAKGWAEFERPRQASFIPLPDPDTYAAQAGFDQNFPVASDGKTEWLTHCYGMVGSGRDMAADTGTGAELYAVTGQAPRHLDRNITVVGRVVQGMELLSALPRGTGPLGFYEKPSQHMKILSVRLAADVPPAQQTRLEVLRTDSASFRAYVAARRNRTGFFVRPAGRIDVCNIPLPVRSLR